MIVEVKFARLATATPSINLILHHSSYMPPQQLQSTGTPSVHLNTYLCCGPSDTEAAVSSHSSAPQMMAQCAIHFQSVNSCSLHSVWNNQGSARFWLLCMLFWLWPGWFLDSAASWEWEGFTNMRVRVSCQKDVNWCWSEARKHGNEPGGQLSSTGPSMYKV